MTKFFSIIVPIYNVEKYLSRCVDSLLKQKFSDMEIILVDDGSTDSSGMICDNFSTIDPRITVIHKKNGGLASARNAGLDCAVGKYVMFIDSDDWIDYDTTEYIYSHLEKYPVDIFKYGYQKVSDGCIIDCQKPYFAEGVYCGNEILDIIMPGMLGPIKLFDYSKMPILSACTCAYSRQFLNDISLRFKSERLVLNEDKLFNIVAMCYASKVEVSHKTFYYYDTRDGSLTQRYIPDMPDRKQVLLNEIQDCLKNRGHLERLKLFFYNYCVDNCYECIANESSNNPGSRKVVSKRVHDILTINIFEEALKKCNHKKLNFKSFAIYTLMRCKMSYSLVVLYRLFTGRQL